jgi:hypothetical protein
MLKVGVGDRSGGLHGRASEVPQLRVSRLAAAVV